MNDIAKFESDLLKTNEGIRVEGGGGTNLEVCGTVFARSRRIASKFGYSTTFNFYY